MFNTGTVVGVSSNIFGSGYQRNFISSFKWGGVSGLQAFDLQKAIDIARNMYKRRGIELNDVEERLLRSIYEITHNYRRM